MDKKHFLSLLYLLGVAPLLGALSISMSNGDNAYSLLIFGIANAFILIIFSLLFSKLPRHKKTTGLAVIGLILLIGVILGGIYRIGDGLSNWLYDQTLAPATSETNTIDAHDNNIDTSETDALLSGDDSMDTENLATTTGDQTTESNPQTDTSTTTPPKYLTVLPDQGTLSYAQVIPYLVDHYDLEKRGNQTFSFRNITPNNVLFHPFEIAASHAMIGTTINPSSKVSCNTYLVLKGMAQGRDIEYTGTPQTAYRAHAVSLGQMNGCADGAFVTKATL